jgi:hypothetical protein
MTPMSAMPMMGNGMSPSSGGMPMMMPMPMPMMMNGMGGMNPMTGGMPMMGGMPGMGMGMPMMAMPMMCRMTYEMTKDGMVCTMRPMDASGMPMMSERCNAMNAMMAMGMPCMVSCNGMPMMMGTMDAGR